MFLCAVGIGVLLAVVWFALLSMGSSRHIGWVMRLQPSAREIIGAAAILTPLLIAARIIERIKRKFLGPEMAAKAAQERRIAEDEKAASVWWTVPKSAEAADWPRVLTIIASLYALTFLLVLAIVPFTYLLDRLFPPRGAIVKDIGAFQAAFYSANVIGITMLALFVVMLVILPRVRVTLISDGVLEALGARKTLIPYSSIREVRIVQSRRRRSLKCVAVLASDERFGERWHRYDLGHEAPVEAIVQALKSRGVCAVIGAAETSTVTTPAS